MEARQEIRPWESSRLKAFRRASVVAFNSGRHVVSTMEEFLSMGGKVLPGIRPCCYV